MYNLLNRSQKGFLQPCLDLFKTGQYFDASTPMTLILQRTEASMSVMCPMANKGQFDYDIESIKLVLGTVNVTNAVMEKYLNAKGNQSQRFPITRLTTNIQLPSKSTPEIRASLFINQVPDVVIITCNNQKCSTGSTEHNPFNNLHIPTGFQLKVWSSTEDQTRATYYEDKSNALLGCYEIFETNENQFTADQFLLNNGYVMYPFKLTTTRNNNGVKVVDPRRGQVQLSLKLGTNVFQRVHNKSARIFQQSYGVGGRINCHPRLRNINNS